MKPPTVGVLCAVLLSACTAYDPPAVIQSSDRAVVVHTIHLDLLADGRDRARIHSEAAALLAREVPYVRVVDHPALADAMLSWQVRRGTPCVDCGDMAERGWSWHGELRHSHGPGVVLFTGTSPANRCCPDRQLIHQVSKYLKAHGENVFSTQGGG